MRIVRRLVTGFIGIAAIVVLAPGLDRTPRQASVILITLDTTRADHLPPFGGADSLPAIARLAQDGVVFEDAMTTTPLTLPAHCSLLTGRLPAAHRVRVNVARLPDELPTLAEQFQRAGYRTAAFVSSVVLDADRGLGRGFDVYEGVNRNRAGSVITRIRRPANEVIDEALEWLNRADETPFFIWIHLYDAHAPYALPEPYGSMLAGDDYDGALAFMDSQLARLIARLDEQGRLNRTGLILAADHGESLGDHGEDGHGIFVYQSVLHVPLIVRWPGVATRKVASLVRLIDIAPTLIEIDRLPTAVMDGKSLVPLLAGHSSSTLDGYAESIYPRQFGWSPLRTLRNGRYKVIEAPRPELYDLESDPAEQHDLSAEQPGTASALLHRLQAFQRGLDLVNHRERDDALARLMSLGYVSGVRSSALMTTTLPDPKDVIGQYNAIVAERRARLGER